MTKKLKNYSFIEKLKTLPFVEAIYLYGSRARGDNEERSDIDLALSCPAIERSEWRMVRNIIDDADTLLAIDCVHLENIQDDRFKKEIERDGVALYKKEV